MFILLIFILLILLIIIKNKYFNKNPFVNGLTIDIENINDKFKLYKGKNFLISYSNTNIYTKINNNINIFNLKSQPNQLKILIDYGIFNGKGTIYKLKNNIKMLNNYFNYILLYNNKYYLINQFKHDDKYVSYIDNNNIKNKKFIGIINSNMILPSITIINDNEKYKQTLKNPYISKSDKILYESNSNLKINYYNYLLD